MQVMTSRKLDDPYQFPVLVSYYLTINRGQGQSLKRAGLYLPKNLFTHGHLLLGIQDAVTLIMFLYAQIKKNSIVLVTSLIYLKSTPTM